jgi:hypothetical protein
MTFSGVHSLGLSILRLFVHGVLTQTGNPRRTLLVVLKNRWLKPTILMFAHHDGNRSQAIHKEIRKPMFGIRTGLQMRISPKAFRAEKGNTQIKMDYD